VILIYLVAGGTLLASFTCSLLEAVLYSLSPARVEMLREAGGAGERLAKLKADVEEPIAAILTVNTVAHTVGSAWCGAMVGELYDSRAVGLFAAIFTVLVLAVTEIVPKSLGVRYANNLGPFIAWPTQLMIWSVWPIVWISKKAMRALMGDAVADGPSEEELLIVTGLALKGGGVRKEEHRWIANALRLDKVTAGDLRTPRTVVESLPADTAISEFRQRPGGLLHSRVPITDGHDQDKVVGLVHRREVFDAILRQADTDLLLGDLLRPIRFVPEDMPAHELLQLFLADKAHMMAVTDEYGGFEGVVTLEDVLESLLGSQIVDEHDQVEDMQKLALERSRERRGLDK
jgi:CBS domain containing-hemolysin-like protein